MSIHSLILIHTFNLSSHSLIILLPALQIEYKKEWEKTKSKACDIGVDDLSVRAAKASRDLASDVSKHTPSHSKRYRKLTSKQISQL